jgi:hypothetical protein
MPVPTVITDLSATAASNSPAGSESVTTTDDYLRTQGSFIRQVYDRVTDGAQAITVGSLTTTGNTVLGDATTDTLNVGAGGLVKDASGNVGLGIVPNSSASKALEIGAAANISIWPAATNLIVHYSRNAYWDNALTWRYKNTDISGASLYSQNSSGHIWYSAGSGTAGAAVTWTEAARIHASGGVSIGNTTDPGATNLSVTGTVTAANLASGTYTPTVTGVSNATSLGVVGGTGLYTRVGNNVFVNVIISFIASSTGAAAFFFTIPVARASNFASSGQAIGVAVSNSAGTADSMVSLNSITGAQTIQVSLIVSNTASTRVSCISFQYTLT